MMPDACSKYTYNWYINRFEEAKSRSEKLYAGVENELLYRKPAPDQWSAGECVSHLVQFGSIYYQRMKQVVEQADADSAGRSQPFKPRLFWRGIMRLFEPPYSLKMKTISIFEPSLQEVQNNGEVFVEFQLLQQRFANQLQQCQQQGIHLIHHKIKNPAAPFLKMSLNESYGIVLAHQRRHLWQAAQVLQNI